VHVLLVDDHPLVREMLQQVVARALNPSCFVVETDLTRAICAASQACRLDLALLDLGLPDYRGIDVLLRFRKSFSQVPVVVVSADEDSGTIRSAMHHGARGYIPKSTATDVMEVALKLVAAGGIYVPHEALVQSAGRAAGRDLSLTERQIDVLKRVVQGEGNRDIAKRLGIAENTVKQHVRAIFHGLGVTTRTEAMIAAARRGLRFD
jgi:DNA-binding NarL/FixJ family response regulator